MGMFLLLEEEDEEMFDIDELVKKRKLKFFKVEIRVKEKKEVDKVRKVKVVEKFLVDLFVFFESGKKVVKEDVVCVVLINSVDMNEDYFDFGEEDVLDEYIVVDKVKCKKSLRFYIL